MLTFTANTVYAQLKAKPIESDTLVVASSPSPKVLPLIITQAKQMKYSYQAPEKLPLFCELEYQTSKLIRRKVKFGVEPK